jgi:hypothetical protein
MPQKPSQSAAIDQERRDLIREFRLAFIRRVEERSLRERSAAHLPGRECDLDCSLGPA